MKKIPYNLYINFETLTSLLEQHYCKEENVLRSGLIGLELSVRLLVSTVERTKGFDALVSQILSGMETQLGVLNLFSFSNPMQLEKTSTPKHIDYLKLVKPLHRPVVDKITEGYFNVSKEIGQDIGIEHQINDIRIRFQLPEMAIKEKNIKEGCAEVCWEA